MKNEFASIADKARFLVEILSDRITNGEITQEAAIQRVLVHQRMKVGSEESFNDALKRARIEWLTEFLTGDVSTLSALIGLFNEVTEYKYCIPSPMKELNIDERGQWTKARNALLMAGYLERNQAGDIVTKE